jgi:hypothetical protein
VEYRDDCSFPLVAYDCLAFCGYCEACDATQKDELKPKPFQSGDECWRQRGVNSGFAMAEQRGEPERDGTRKNKGLG